VRLSSAWSSHVAIDQNSRAATPATNAARKAGLKKEPVGDVSAKTAEILFRALLTKQSGLPVDECSTKSCRETQEGESTVSPSIEQFHEAWLTVLEIFRPATEPYDLKALEAALANEREIEAQIQENLRKVALPSTPPIPTISDEMRTAVSHQVSTGPGSDRVVVIELSSTSDCRCAQEPSFLEQMYS
jgi:hypothetical protein